MEGVPSRFAFCAISLVRTVVRGWGLEQRLFVDSWLPGGLVACLRVTVSLG